MALPVLNMLSPLVDTAGLILKPWNSFFQQFTQAPNATIDLGIPPSPFAYELKETGQLSIDGGAITSITLTRGRITVDVTGSKLIFGQIKDIITIVYTVPPTFTFFPQY